MENLPDHASLLQGLADTPGKLEMLAARFDEQALCTPPQPGEWSAVEILAHLHGCGEAWTPSIFRMLTEEHPSFTEIHPRQKAKKESYAQLDFETLVTAFSQRREALLQKMKGLPAEDWQRGARINRQERTVFSHIRRMAMHEVGHLEQMEAMLQAAKR